MEEYEEAVTVLWNRYRHYCFMKEYTEETALDEYQTFMIDLVKHAGLEVISMRGGWCDITLYKVDEYYVLFSEDEVGIARSLEEVFKYGPGYGLFLLSASEYYTIDTLLCHEELPWEFLGEGVEANINGVEYVVRENRFVHRVFVDI